MSRPLTMSNSGVMRLLPKHGTIKRGVACRPLNLAIKPRSKLEQVFSRQKRFISQPTKMSMYTLMNLGLPHSSSQQAPMQHNRSMTTSMRRTELRQPRKQFSAAEYPEASRAPMPTNKETRHQIVETKLHDLNAMLASESYEDLSSIFTASPYWRDHLGIDQTRLTTLSGLSKIAAYLKSRSSSRLANIAIEKSREVQVTSIDPAGTINCLQSFVTFDTIAGAGRGVVKLIQDAENRNEWRIFSLFTTLTETKLEKKERIHCVPEGWGKGINYQEYREEKREFTKEEPQVLIVGKLRDS